MKFRFNRDNFMKNAKKNTKEKLKYVLNELENKEVDFTEDNENGTLVVDWYGVEHELYPVKKEWCIKTDL